MKVIARRTGDGQLPAAPCTAMVFAWSNLCDGDPTFTLNQVALNDLLMVILFAPIVGLLSAGRPLERPLW